MKYVRLLPLIIITMLTSVVASCISDDITTAPGVRLYFSTDTLSFDTVFTDVGTPTARLWVFNREKKGVNISSIRFRNPDSRFSMNVDGVSGESFSNVEIRGGDSILIFVECLIPPSSADTPQLTMDDLEFTTNGVTQSLPVVAWGQNVTRLRNYTVTEDMTLTAERPYVIFDTLTVAKGANLTIAPGARLYFHDKAGIHVEGSLKAVGAPGNIISMRGDRTGDILTDIGYDIMSGQWGGIRFAPESFNNQIEYVDMRSSSFGIVADSCATSEQRKILLRNSWLHNSKGSVLTANNAKIDAYGVCFSDAAQAVVSLAGGEINFVQCTIANYYLWTIYQPALCLYRFSAQEAEPSDQPLMKANFNNCIIYGINSDLNFSDLEGSDVYFRYVLLKSEGSDDNNFLNCLWGEDPLFYTEREKYIFDYRLQPDSPAIGAGDPELVVGEALIDFYGLNRLSNGRPALGAFVFVQPTELPG